MRPPRWILLAPIFLGLTATPAAAQFPYGEWGDAPDGWTAYWDNGNGGQFPTCNGGLFIYHAPSPLGIGDNCYFGMDADRELDGNGGVCFEPYELDECYWALDGDAGLVMPTAFSYGPTRQLITCSGLPPTSLGQVCTMAQWGQDIDITITNNLTGGQPAYLNVLFDWDRSGDWSAFPAGPSGCGVQIAEHVIRNMLIPANFNGLASQLGLANFQLGPDSGVVWVRFTITNTPVLFPFVGAGWFEYGETEDYLLRVAPSEAAMEMGDAPHGVLAYPPAGGTIGKFPTCVSTPSHVSHAFSAGIYLGPGLDPENDGNHDQCNFIPYDNDECFADGDAGLVVPRPFTIDAATSSIEPCDAMGSVLANSCDPIAWGTNLDLQLTNSGPAPAFLNMLADWDHDGRWQNVPGAVCPGGATIDEHVLTNLAVSPGTSGLLSSLMPPAAVAGNAGYVWVRFTISDVPAPANWDGSGDMGFGETEDYLLLVAGDNTGVDPGGSLLSVGEPWPNPARGPVRIDYMLPKPTRVEAIVVDASGRRIRDLGGAAMNGGPQRLVWDGRTTLGRDAPSGVYFVHLRIGGVQHVRKVLRLH